MKLLKAHHLMFAAALTLLAVFFALAGQGLLRTVFTLPLVFVLPGYAVMAAFFPKRLASYPGNILFVTTWSLAITSLGTVILHKLGIGLRTDTWALGLGGVTLANLAIAALQGKVIFDPAKTYRVPVYQVFVFSCALLMGVFALNLARQGAMLPRGSAFTQLWMMPSDNADVIEVGVRNNEGESVNYRLVVTGEVFEVEETFVLAANGSWEARLELPPDAGAKVEAQLYRDDMPNDVYRTTHVWLP